MQWWAIIKLIAGIIANLPFSEQATEAEVESAVTQAVESFQADDSDSVVSMTNAGIPRSDWEELIQLLTPVFLWFLARRGK
jgi:hypothetical protein